MSDDFAMRLFEIRNVDDWRNDISFANRLDEMAYAFEEDKAGLTMLSTSQLHHIANRIRERS